MTPINSQVISTTKEYGADFPNLGRCDLEFYLATRGYCLRYQLPDSRVDDALHFPYFDFYSPHEIFASDLRNDSSNIHLIELNSWIKFARTHFIDKEKRGKEKNSLEMVLV